MADEKHLWEAEHSYYCSECNYYSNETAREFQTWADFLDEFGESDMDYNLLFRWDWKLPEKPSEDPYYRDGKLQIFWMGQRKGLYFYSEVAVCKADEPAVREFLGKRWEHLRALWEPVSRSEP